MRKYRKHRSPDPKRGSSVRRAIAAQANLPPETIQPDDLERMEAEARRQLDRNRRLLGEAEQHRYR